MWKYLGRETERWVREKVEIHNGKAEKVDLKSCKKNQLYRGDRVSTGVGMFEKTSDKYLVG